MPEGVGYGPQFTASVGKTLNYIGNHAYAYSGVVGATSSGTTFIKFTTGKEYISGKIQCVYSEPQSDDMTYLIKINGITVQTYVHVGATGVSVSDTQPQRPTLMIIPPLSQVEVIITSAATTRNNCVIFTGRIYK